MPAKNLTNTGKPTNTPPKMPAASAEIQKDAPNVNGEFINVTNQRSGEIPGPVAPEAADAPRSPMKNLKG